MHDESIYPIWSPPSLAASEQPFLKKPLCVWKTQILPCPSSAVLQHPALVIANESCASCLCESSSCTRGKFNNDKLCNNGKTVGAKRSHGKIFLTCCDSGPCPGLSNLCGPVPAPASGSLPCESCNSGTTPRDIPAWPCAQTDLILARGPPLPPHPLHHHHHPPTPFCCARLVCRCVPWRKASGMQGWSQRSCLWPGCGRDSEAAAGRSHQATGASGGARRASPPPPVDRAATSGGHWHTAGTFIPR